MGEPVTLVGLKSLAPGKTGIDKVGQVIFLLEFDGDKSRFAAGECQAYLVDDPGNRHLRARTDAACSLTIRPPSPH